MTPLIERQNVEIVRLGRETGDKVGVSTDVLCEPCR
jgi:hypothetical protein